MRTTVTLDSDVAQEIKALLKDGRPFKQVVNEAMRLGLRQLHKPVAPRRYRTQPRKMGLRPGQNLDNVAELIADSEGEGWR
ncbi:MAG: DUF2191 domain-containing protein [Tepidisphaeraceae bacterium]|jgi:hypothetical protein